MDRPGTGLGSGARSRPNPAPAMTGAANRKTQRPGGPADAHQRPISVRPARRRWWKELTRYQWFVFIVASLGWLFDTMDQQLFNLARQPAMAELIGSTPGDPTAAGRVAEAAGMATTVFIVGWAIGGLIFGILGDRIGRVKTMMITILLYSAFTGLSALSTGVWDFAAYRFLTGLGVGGEFAVGVTLVAEVMSDRGRPHALGWLQALSAIGNVGAAILSLAMTRLEKPRSSAVTGAGCS